LITQTGLTSQQIKSWFYNRRKRDRFAKPPKTAQKPPIEDHLQRDDEHIYIIHDGVEENNLDETHDYSHCQENLVSTETTDEISVQDNPNHKVADEDSDSDIEILSETIRSSQDPSSSTGISLFIPNQKINPQRYQSCTGCAFLW
jgi:septum formation inhibitor MinC